jgi:MFS superfamily sulfate permease-like transporter
VIFQFGADLFYANAGRFAEDVRALVDGVDTPVNWLVVDAGAITSVDYSAARVLRDLQQDLNRLGIALCSFTRNRRCGPIWTAPPERVHWRRSHLRDLARSAGRDTRTAR